MPIKESLMKNAGQYPYYIFGITMFFVLHGYSRFIGLVSVKDLTGYFVVSSLIATLVLIILKYVFKSVIKAGLITAMVLIFYLFFGDIKAGLQNSFLEVISRYSVIFATFVFLLLIASIYISRSTASFSRVQQYLNILFLVLCLYDAWKGFNSNMQGVAPPREIKVVTEEPCDSCHRPDIYLVVLDEYAGKETLKQHFNYDNSLFLDFLRKRGFHVAENSSSNYSASAVSVASMFNMSNVPWAKNFESLTAEDNARAEKLMDSSVLLQVLKKHNYQFYNHSIFQIDNQPSEFDPGLLPTRLKLITAQTLLSKVEKDLSGSVNTFFGKRFDWAEERYEQKFRDGNNHLLDLTGKSLRVESDAPKFVYTHLLMPHAPYVYDSLGNKVKNKFFSEAGGDEDANMYLQYLVYSNTAIRKLVEEIQITSHNKAVIVVMSDHGYRKPDYGKDFRNNNLNAVFLPGDNYQQFYDSISNYNQFRVILNTLFDSQLPLLRDSTYF